MKNSMALLMLALLVGFQSFAVAADNYVIKKSPYSVDRTLDRLENVLKKKGITIFTRVDHAAGASRVGIPMNDTRLLIFGNPKMGTPLINENIMMALDLPMKALAWKDADGQVWLSYLKPSVLQQRHDLKNQTIINKMTGALNAMTDKAVEKI
ncbi:MAG: DUF302 domain-containing protein [Gammaproteobacteria bacterium]|nr:DUF302 domain-containing protein [Gammaproteobacteria bacterium]